MSERCRMIVLAWVLGVAAACGGGSGSTGLIDSEGALIDHVRQTGTCAESEGAAFCATDSPNAIAPGGQRARVVVATPTPQTSPSPAETGIVASPTPAATGVEASATTAASPSGVPVPTVSPTPGAPTVQVVVEGFGPDAACAVAARAEGSDEAWHTGQLVVVDGGTAAIAFPLPTDVTEPSEIVLLCFAPAAPAVLPPEIETLAEVSPTVVFVLPGS